MALPVFYVEEEEDAYWWILCVEKFFKEQGTRETLKVVKAITSFRGHALRWWIWRSQYKAPTTWDTFTTVFLFHFKPEWREILPIEDEEEQPYLDSTKSVDETSFHDEFVVEQIPSTDGDLKESSSSDLYDEVEPDLKSMTTIKKTSCLENFVVEPVSSIDERVVIPMLKPKQQQIDSLVFTVSTPYSKITYSICVVKSHFIPMDFSDEVEFSVTPIPPKPPDSPSLRVSNVTTLFYSKPFDLIPKEKRLLPISDPNILSTPFPSKFASSKDAHDFPKSFLHKPSLLELESQQSMESTSFQKKFGLSSLFQICRPTHNLALGDGFYLVATALHDTIIHSLHIFQTPTTLDTSVKLVVETQFKDARFHDDADFVIPPKPPDHTLDINNSITHPQLLSENNFLCGEVLEFMYGLHNLTRLSLAYNNFNGEISSSFNKLSRLDTLSLEQNRFTSSVPELNVSPLHVFNVSFNTLTGPIPLRFSHLDISAFSVNELCGIPFQIYCPGNNDRNKKNGLSQISNGLGAIHEDYDENRLGYSKGEYFFDNLNELLRFLRRDDPRTRDVIKQVCKWNVVSKDLVPIIEHYHEDGSMLLNAVKVLVFLTMPIEPGSTDVSQQLEYLWGLKSVVTNSDAATMIVGNRTIFLNNRLQHWKELNDPIVYGVFIEKKNMLTRGRMDLSMSLCFAESKGDDLLLHQLLKRGLDPNKSDNNGRTTVHIAASKGKGNCVLLLLYYGANSNSRDSYGNVALWEAILGGHETVTKLLVQNGATLQSGHAVAKNKDILKRNMITHVLNYVGFECPEYSKADFIYRTLWLQDNPSEVLYMCVFYHARLVQYCGNGFKEKFKGLQSSWLLLKFMKISNSTFRDNIDSYLWKEMLLVAQVVMITLSQFKRWGPGRRKINCDIISYNLEDKVVFEGVGNDRV